MSDQPAILGRSKWGGPGMATGGTAKVYTSAGDCMEGVSSAGGVKSISSSKLSSNSWGGPMQMKPISFVLPQRLRHEMACVFCLTSFKGLGGVNSP